MYESHFQFQRRPFSATPDSDCLFITDNIRETIAEFVISMQRGQGIGVLTGAAGMGKTLLCGRLAEELSEQFQVALLKNANFATRRSLLQSVLFELGQTYTGMAEQELRLELEKYCESALADSDGVALIIDEAHLMSQRLLEEVRCITNLTTGGIPLVRVLLSGQPALEETLAKPGMAALNQRIASQHYLESLSRFESRQYIEYRTNWGGANPQQIFTDDAIAAIAHAADGVPRALNQLCDHTLLLAFVSNQPCADAELVDEALEDLRQLPLHWNERKHIAGPLDALKKKSTDLAEFADADEDVEPFDFEAFSNDGMESIEIGGMNESPVENEILDEEISLPVEEEEHVVYALAHDDEEIAIEPVISESDDVIEMDRLELETENEEEVPMETIDISSQELPHKSSAIAGVVPLVDDHQSGAVMFEEELVIDRYAALDAERRERPPLTAASHTEEPQPEMPMETPGFEELEAVEELATAEPVAADMQDVPTDSRELENENDTVQPVEEPTGDALEAANLNKSLKSHRNVIDQINALDFGEVATSETSDFDVVELEPAKPSQTLRHDRQPAATDQSATNETEESAVPRPNLRRLFTKLRRVQHERSGR
ncbi:ExeA family protein [Symmachiella dynata]|uniref:ExeA family protein n=1 Tax=Symmachiella dynata TaxID=2527995 RepID=UPI0030EF2828